MNLPDTINGYCALSGWRARSSEIAIAFEYARKRVWVLGWNILRNRKCMLLNLMVLQLGTFLARKVYFVVEFRFSTSFFLQWSIVVFGNYITRVYQTFQRTDCHFLALNLQKITCCTLERERFTCKDKLPIFKQHYARPHLVGNYRCGCTAFASLFSRNPISNSWGYLPTSLDLQPTFSPRLKYSHIGIAEPEHSDNRVVAISIAPRVILWPRTIFLSSTFHSLPFLQLKTQQGLNAC